MQEEKENSTVQFGWLDLGKAILYFLDGHQASFAFWFSLLFIVFFWGLIPPLIIAHIIELFTQSTSVNIFPTVFIWIMGLGIAHIIVSLVRLTSKRKVADLEAEAVYQARVKGFERLIDFSLRWHDSQNTGNKVQRIQNGTKAIQDLRSMMNQNGIQTITQIVGIFAIFIFLKPIFILFLVMYLSIFFFIHFAFYKKMEHMNNEYNQSQEKSSGTYYEGLNNVLTIKTLGVKDSFKTTIFANEEETKQFSFRMRKVGINKWKIFQLFNGVSMIIYLLTVCWGVIQGTFTVGDIFIFYSYLNNLMEAAGHSTDLFDTLIQSKSAIARMMPIYWEKEDVQYHGNSLFPKNWKEITIKNGSFTYKKPVENSEYELFNIKNLNFIIHKNEKIGVAGLSGGGKSTFAKLFLGLYALEHGEFKIDDLNFYDIKHSEITKEISIVLQDSEMFNMTLRDNITLLRQVNPKLLQKAIQIAQLEDLLSKLPDGLDTFIGEKGYRLSGGERQRIGIARAICKDSQIFVFDESTSSLDSKTEQLIQEALETELKNKTIIIIAHRISTLKHVDKICVFEDGKIVEEGKYDELMNDSTSKFHDVYNQQRKQKV